MDKALDHFEMDLARLIGRPTDLRPFVCDGPPLTCEAFIVGFNPATELSSDFWDFWKPDYGFDKRAWLQHYISDRRAAGHRKTLSPTRNLIERVIEAAHPVRCLETNIYAAPSKSAGDLAEHRRITAPFDFLLETIGPKVILAHGRDAIAHVTNRAHNADVIESYHFASREFRNLGIAEAQRLGRSVREKARVV
jgi:hypothetical protein